MGAINLLAHWNGHALTNASRQTTASPTGEQPDAVVSSGDEKAELWRWQQWYAEKFPDAPPAELPVDSGRDKWSYDEVLTFLESDAGRKGDPTRGQAAFAQAKCASCHRVAGQGETAGPDLTAVARRFQRKEILQSIVYPSHDISDQFASRVVTAGGKSYAGLVMPRGQAGVTVLLATGEKVDLAHEDIDDIRPSSISAMPTGLLNPLTLEQVADLFAYLSTDGTVSVAAKPTAAAAK